MAGGNQALRGSPLQPCGIRSEGKGDGGPKGWIQAAESSAAFRGPGPKEPFGRATHGSSTSLANQASRSPRQPRAALRSAPLARLSSPRVGPLSHSTPPRTRGLRCPLAGKYSPFNSPHLSQQFRLPSAG